jgi:hypothetical protein
VKAGGERLPSDGTAPRSGCAGREITYGYPRCGLSHRGMVLGAPSCRLAAREDTVEVKVARNNTVPPPRVSGVIDGSMTVSHQADGSLSFRVIVETGGRPTAEPGLLELIISPEHVRQLNRALADYGTKGTWSSELVASFACNIGFRSMALSSANATA